MNQAKAEFFDSQVEEPWASSALGSDEMAKIERMLRHGQLEEGMRVIEPGCGTGRLTTILADLVGSAGFVLALDISSKMIDVAQRRIGQRANVCIECASIDSYALDSQSYDAVVCHNVFPHFDSKPAAVAHLASALTHGGKFIVCHFMGSSGINDLHRKAHPSVLNDLLPSETEMKDIFAAAGLQVEMLEDGDGYLLVATRS
jgi:ubiquinone/menaquinone biosynthesis C-methylase UbiE